MPVGTANYAWQMPDQGTDPWATLFYALLNSVDSTMLSNQVPTGLTLEWGDVSAGNYLSCADGGSPTLMGTWNFNHIVISNIMAQAVGVLPGVAPASQVGQLVSFQEKLWVCVEQLTPVWHPLTRPFLVVNASANRRHSEYNNIATALAAVPAGGATVLVMGTAQYNLAAPLVVPADTQLIGIGDPVIDCTGTTHCVTVTDVTDVLIEGITFQGGATDDGIRITSTADDLCARITIRRCRFTSLVNAIEFLESGAVDFIVADARIQDCQFTGTAAGGVGESAIYSETEHNQLWIEGCYFTGWGRVAAQATIDMDGNAGSRWVHIRDCVFEDNGIAATGVEPDIDINDVDDVTVEGCTSENCAGGDAFLFTTVERLAVTGCIGTLALGYGLHLVGVTDFTVGDCVFDTCTGGGVRGDTSPCRGNMANIHVVDPAGNGFHLDGVDDSAFSNCTARGSTAGDGWEITNCDRTTFVGCRADNNNTDGFSLITNTYLVFKGCVARGNGGAPQGDLRTAVGTTNSRLGFTLEAAPVGVMHTSNGIQRSYSIPLGNFDGAPAGAVIAATWGQIGVENWVGWEFVNGFNSNIAGTGWTVPENIVPNSTIGIRVKYVSQAVPGAPNVNFKWDLDVLSIDPGVTLITAGGVAHTITDVIVAQNQIERSPTAISVVVGTWVAAERALLFNIERDVAVANNHTASIYVVDLEAEVYEHEIEIRP